jgi:ribosome biogenesis GTPase
MSSSLLSLSQLGWRAHFSQQLTIEDLERFTPARVVSVQRSGLTLWSEHGESHAPAATLARLVATVGDWVLADLESNRVERLLERSSLLARMAAGSEQRTQPIAANIDTLFVVTSCNDDFNASRLERYLALAHDAHIDPIIVVTKRDLCADVDELLAELEEIAPDIPAMAVNATDPMSTRCLSDWLTAAATIAFVGSSGVGKSTLVNTLTGVATLTTGGIREHDSKGRHTTTARQMIAMPGGAWLIDTPGMRELKVGAIGQGIRATFDDVEALARHCKFRDCRHQRDVGCAVLAAITAGTLSERRLTNYLKLQREAQHATQSVFERREASRRFGRMHKVLQEQHRRDRGKR